MQVHTLPTSRGWAWLAEGWRLWRRSPRALMSPLPWLWLIFLLMAFVPVVGDIIGIFLLIPLQVGVYIVLRAADLGQAVGPTLRGSLRTNRRGLLRLSLAALLTSLAVAILTAVVLAISGMLPAGIMTGDEARTLSLAEAARIQIIALIIGAPVSMAFWFAPVLVGIRGIPAVKAMFFSLVACWRNMRAFVMFLLVVGAALVGMVSLSALLSQASVVLGTLVMLPVMLIGASVLLGAVYTSVKDVFGDLVVDEPSI